MALASRSPSLVAKEWIAQAVQYSALKLTVPSDRLPAITGLAKMVHEIMNCRYLAGIWEDTIPESLLWLTYHPSPSHPEWRADRCRP
jgi:hypothetical protein